MIDRRAVLGWTFAGSAAFVLSRAGGALTRQSVAADTPMFYDWKPTRVPHVLTAAGTGGNMVLILGAEGHGAILIDTQACPYGPQIRREAEHLGTKVELLVCTHHHPEITGGNRAFTADTRVIGHRRNAERIPGQMNRYISQIKEFLFRKEDPVKLRALEVIRTDFVELHKHKGALKPVEFTPNETFDVAQKELVVGGRRLVLLSMSGAEGAHTDNDVAVHLPDDDVLITGGLVAAGMHAVVDRESGAHTRGWAAALHLLESHCTTATPATPDVPGSAGTLVIPGEGPAGTVVLLQRQREYLADLRAAVERAVKLGHSRQEVRALKPDLRGGPANMGADMGADAGTETRLYMSLDAVYDEVIADQHSRDEVRKPN